MDAYRLSTPLSKEEQEVFDMLCYEHPHGQQDQGSLEADGQLRTMTGVWSDDLVDSLPLPPRCPGVVEEFQVIPGDFESALDNFDFSGLAAVDAFDFSQLEMDRQTVSGQGDNDIAQSPACDVTAANQPASSSTQLSGDHASSMAQDGSHWSTGSSTKRCSPMDSASSTLSGVLNTCLADAVPAPAVSCVAQSVLDSGPAYPLQDNAPGLLRQGANCQYPAMGFSGLPENQAALVPNHTAESQASPVSWEQAQNIPVAAMGRGATPQFGLMQDPLALIVSDGTTVSWSYWCDDGIRRFLSDAEAGAARQRGVDRRREVVRAKAKERRARAKERRLKSAQ